MMETPQHLFALSRKEQRVVIIIMILLIGATALRRSGMAACGLFSLLPRKLNEPSRLMRNPRRLTNADY